MNTMYERESVTVTMSAKVSIGPYESADLYIAVKDLAIGATDDRINEAMDTATRTYEAIRAQFRQQVVELSAGMSAPNRERLREQINAEHATNGAKK